MLIRLMTLVESAKKGFFFISVQLFCQRLFLSYIYIQYTRSRLVSCPSLSLSSCIRLRVHRSVIYFHVFCFVFVFFIFGKRERETRRIIIINNDQVIVERSRREECLRWSDAARAAAALTASHVPVEMSRCRPINCCRPTGR